jgi:hypothetical protein
MGFIAKSTGSGENFEPIPEGVHIARCTGLIDLGMQYSEQYKKSSHRAMIMWEFVDETYENEEKEIKCKTITKEYGLSLHEKSNLTKVLEAWRGLRFTEEELKGFDLNKILGKACQIQIIHTVKGDKTYANIAAIMALPKGLKVEPPKSTLVYDLDIPSAVEEITKLPEWIQKKVMESENWKELTNDKTGATEENHNNGDPSDSDFPFNSPVIVTE